MNGSYVLSRLLFNRPQSHIEEHRTYSSACTHDWMMNSVCVVKPAEIEPDRNTLLRKFCVFGSFIMLQQFNKYRSFKCMLMSLAVSSLYIYANKAQSKGNAFSAHEIGMHASLSGAVLMSLGWIFNFAPTTTCKRFLCGFLLLAWYDYGRYLLWKEHVVELASESEKNICVDELADFISPSMEVGVTRYQPLQTWEDIDW